MNGKYFSLVLLTILVKTPRKLVKLQELSGFKIYSSRILQVEKCYKDNAKQEFFQDDRYCLMTKLESF